MNSRGIIVLLGIVGLFFFQACQKETIYTGLTGELMGRAYLQELASYSGDQSVKVSLTNNQGVNRNVYTDSINVFRFTDLETGIYDLTFTKDSFAAYKINGYRFIGGEIPEYIYAEGFFNGVGLRELPYIDISDFSYDTIDVAFIPTIYLKANINISKGSAGFRLFLNNSDQVAFNNYISTLGEEGFYSHLLDDTTLQIILPAVNVKGFKQGETVYIRMYPSAFNYNVESYTYIDKETGLDIYPINIENESEVVKFTYPPITE